jgi:hypothetical protein
MVAMALFPVFVTFILIEKNEGLLEMMKLMGLSRVSYALGNYLWMFSFYLISISLYYGVSYGMANPAFTNVSPALILALLLCWGHAQIGLAVFIGSLPLHWAIVSMMSFFFVIIIAVVGMLLNGLLNPWPWGLIAFPPFAFCRAASLILKYGGDQIVWGSERSYCLLAMFAEGWVR